MNFSSYPSLVEEFLLHGSTLTFPDVNVIKSNLSNNPFSFFERSIRLLAVDDEPSILNAYSEFLDSYKLYDVTCVSSAKEGANLLSSSKRFHVCISDLGILDIGNDEYYLIKTFSHKTVFIVVTARDDLDKGFQSKASGAFAVLRKSINFLSLDLVNMINEAYVRSIMLPERIDNLKPVINEIVKAFCLHKPATISKWAQHACVEARYLRKAWSDCYGYSPRYFLWLHRILADVLSYYNSLYSEEGRANRAIGKESPAGQIEYINNKFNRFYQTHKDVFDRVLGPRT